MPSVVYDKPVTIQSWDTDADEWDVEEPWASCHASVNMSQSSDYTDAGSERSTQSLEFRIRYFAALKEIRLNTQMYRIVYDGAAYNINGYDDFMEQHREVKLTGVSYA